MPTAADAAKALRIDDAYYHANAAHVAAHPLDPYGFTAVWGERPVPANDVLCPPVLPYWWARRASA